MLENTWREIDYRLDVLRATKGAHVEVYWCVVKKNFLSYVLKKKSLYSTHSSFLAINVCNQGNTLCSPCIISTLVHLLILLCEKHNSFHNRSVKCSTRTLNNAFIVSK
jgi:hypothetical protein